MLTAVAVVLALLACAAAGLAFALRLLGLDPVWVARARHALAEARHRAAGVLVEFADWLRLGR